MPDSLSKLNFLWLFVGLLLLVLAEPAIHYSDENVALLMEGAFTGLILLGIWSLRPFRRWFPLALTFVFADLLAITMYLWVGNFFWSVISVLTSLAFCLVSVVLTMYFILNHPRIDANHVLGALSVYLLLGVIWSFFYSLLRLWEPGALANIDAEPGQIGETSELLYYSFITLTTLGYGDVVPLTPMARSLAILEVVVGQVFLAVLMATIVARLVEASKGVGR